MVIASAVARCQWFRTLLMVVDSVVVAETLASVEGSGDASVEGSGDASQCRWWHLLDWFGLVRSEWSMVFEVDVVEVSAVG